MIYGTSVEFECPECSRPGEVSVHDQPVEWECDCHRVLLISATGQVAAVGYWEVTHVYD